MIYGMYYPRQRTGPFPTESAAASWRIRRPIVFVLNREIWEGSHDLIGLDTDVPWYMEGGMLLRCGTIGNPKQPPQS